MSDTESANSERHEEEARVDNEAAKGKLERQLLWVEIFTALGIWATLVATAIAIVDARRVSQGQMGSLAAQQTLMQGQLDAMIAQQRPWISALPRLKLSLTRDVTPDRSPDIEVPVTIELTNHGASPATNVLIYSMLVPISAAHDAAGLNDAEEDLCARAEQASNDAKKLGITLFPGEQKSGSGIASAEYPAATVTSLFVMQGCIEYTYGAGLHGKTAYRMYLGHFDTAAQAWEGFQWRTDAKHSAPGAGVLLEMTPNTIDFRETDDGGNWAR